MKIDPREAATLRRNLLRWYDRGHRALPWRAEPPETANPYCVLVSEAMLQQTQVATVVPFFNRFMAEFPAIQALAAASEQDVLRLWQGLGYYRRARHLHAAARQVMEGHGGQLPDNIEKLRSLPGVGRYTAGAVASIAFGRREALVDGNVTRVLARWFALCEPIDQPAVRLKLWGLAEQLVPPSRPGDFNQALMELGALVCTPRQPQCPECPMARSCQAHAAGLVEEIPCKGRRRIPKPVEHHVLAIRRKGQLLFIQRPEKGLWSNMWQLPTAEKPDSGKGKAIDAAGLVQWAREHLGIRISSPQRAGEFFHQTTHRSIGFVVWNTRVVGKGDGNGKAIRRCCRIKKDPHPNPLPQKGEGAMQWRDPTEVDDLPLSNPQRKVLAIIAKRQSPA